ncbi:DegT/DnrJ/EryC1/StrS family aminotransferase [Sphaerospermopsis kisseleviana]|uniref:DegT/DnrJ/EryC1/StrS family aminotransferase n=1 Tax=Sphaerospermopsis kisseleviana TaxID=289435 RepID=UPI000BBC82F7
MGTGDWDLKEIVEFVQKHDLWLIEDNCNALGSLYQGQKTGTFRHIATVSSHKI